VTEPLRLADLLAETGRVAARLASRTDPGPVREHLRDIHDECLDTALDVALHTDATWDRGPDHWRRLAILPGLWAPATVYAAIDDVLASALTEMVEGALVVPRGLDLAGRLAELRRMVAVLCRPTAVTSANVSRA
jgi:hypothetical protein